jgi:hypothetical protein
MVEGGKSGGAKPGDPRRAERRKMALRDNLRRRKAQMKGRAQVEAGEKSHDSAGIGPEIAADKPKG